MIGYPLELLHEEVAFLATRSHWSYETVMNLEHLERRKWVKQIAKSLAVPRS